MVITGLRPAATTMPCSAPTTAVPAMTSTIAKTCGTPSPISSTNETMAAIAVWVMASETKLPDSVIGVIATATMPTVAALRRMARRLSRVMNFGVSAIATSATITTAAMAAIRSSRSRRSAAPAPSGFVGSSAVIVLIGQLTPPPGA